MSKKPLTSMYVPNDSPLTQPDPPVRVPDPPDTLSFEAFSVAMAAYVSGSGYCERFGYVAHRQGERQVELSIPAGPLGGHFRYLVTFPEQIPVKAEHAE